MGETVKIWKSIQTRRDGFHWETLVPIPNIEIKALGLYENILTEIGLEPAASHGASSPSG